MGISTLTFSLLFFSHFLYTNKVMLSMSRALLLLIFFQQLNQSTFVLLIYTSYNTFVVLILLIDTDRYFLGYFFCLYLLSVTLKLCETVLTWSLINFRVLLNDIFVCFIMLLYWTVKNCFSWGGTIFYYNILGSSLRTIVWGSQGEIETGCPSFFWLSFLFCS